MKSYEDILELIAARRRTWLVTGAAGFIGSHLTERLLVLGQHVVGLDNFSTGFRHNLDLVRDSVGAARWQNFRLIEGDIGDLATCQQACHGVDRVLHQAALGSVPRSVDAPIGSNESNVDGFLNMLVAARDAGVPRFVYASSSSVYGDDPELPKIESRLGQPLSPYAVTKRVDELYADVFARNYGTSSIGLRYFNVFGPRQNPDGDYAAVIPKWIGALLRQQPCQINGDGETARDFCYVDNAVQANLLAAMSDDPAAANQVYNVALNGQTSLNELYDILRELLATHIPEVASLQPVYREFRPGDMRFSRADIGKAHRLLGYHPVWPVKRGLRKTVDWYLARYRTAPVSASVNAPGGTSAPATSAVPSVAAVAERLTG